MKYYMGLDLSLTGTGVVVIDQDCNVKHAETIKTNLKGEARLEYINNHVFDLVTDHEPLNLATMGSRAGQAFSIGELGGVVKLMLYKNGFDLEESVLIVPPTRLKKYITGKGNAPKDTIMMHVYKTWGFEPADNNQGDAYGLAMLAYAYHNKSKVPKFQQEVLTAIREGK